MSVVLILDDDRVFRRMLQASLELRGHRVLEAGRRAEANELLAREAPDAIVVDGLLPDTTGAVWLEKQRRAGCKTPVLFVSAFWKSMREFELVTKTLGAADLLRKPVAPDAVVDRLEAMLGA